MIHKQMLVHGPPIAASDFMFEAAVGNIKHLSKGINARGNNFFHVMTKAAVRHRTSTYFGHLEECVTIALPEGGIVPTVGANVSQDSVNGTLRVVTVDANSECSMVVGNITGGSFVSGVALVVEHTACTAAIVLRVVSRCVPPQPMIAKRPVIYMDRAKQPPLLSEVVVKLKQIVNSTSASNEIVPVYLRRGDTDRLYIPARLRRNDAVVVYELGTTKNHESVRFRHTNVTIAELETYCPSDSTFWSRAIVYHGNVIGERWEFHDAVSVRPQLQATVRAQRTPGLDRAAKK